MFSEVIDAIKIILIASIVLSIIFIVIVYVLPIISSIGEDKEQIIKTVQTGGEIIYDAGEQLYEQGKDNAPVLLEAGETVCNIDDIVLEEINTSMINFNMKASVGKSELRHISNMESRGNATACEVAILNDMFPTDITGNELRNQIGITKAMKNIKGCTLIACEKEYQVIKYLEDEK